MLNMLLVVMGLSLSFADSNKVKVDTDNYSEIQLTCVCDALDDRSVNFNRDDLQKGAVVSPIVPTGLILVTGINPNPSQEDIANCIDNEDNKAIDSACYKSFMNTRYQCGQIAQAVHPNDPRGFTKFQIKECYGPELVTTEAHY